MHDFPVLEIGGLSIDISSFIAITVTWVIVFAFVMLATRNLSVDKPSKLQNVMEWAIEFVHGLVASSMSLKNAQRFISFGLTLIIFIFVANLLGLPFGIVTKHHEPLTMFGTQVISEADLAARGGHMELAWWKSPTADISVTAGLALITFFLVHFNGIRLNARHYFAHYFKPNLLFFPLNVLETLVKPMTLAVRLYANIFAGELLIAVILMLGLVGAPLLAVWQGFSIFVGAIQAFLFTILTMVYIGQAVDHEEH
jgi:F-type H+-transporting ATPase subunit a